MSAILDLPLWICHFKSAILNLPFWIFICAIFLLTLWNNLVLATDFFLLCWCCFTWLPFWSCHFRWCNLDWKAHVLSKKHLICTESSLKFLLIKIVPPIWSFSFSYPPYWLYHFGSFSHFHIYTISLLTCFCTYFFVLALKYPVCFEISTILNLPFWISHFGWCSAI